ncbi:hypothetical protein IHE49_07085 [Rhodanobacter sp. 7MK24]|uniref:hypothetical protein n=1 Tax=Rhodanobacter sp. 7MK24 TaxID=2775922 RepID=UPI00177E4936|nr:hypothetical protein [Rhodanobacter sp. 7MK24]MBD8880241.1 hypothetical protein [Rhodanobacter sp. 7MK24]
MTQIVIAWAATTPAISADSFPQLDRPALAHLRTGFVEVGQVRSDWAPDPQHPHPKLAKPHRVLYGITLIGRLFEEGTLGRVGRALEAKVAVAGERPPGF